MKPHKQITFVLIRIDILIKKQIAKIITTKQNFKLQRKLKKKKRKMKELRSFNCDLLY